MIILEQASTSDLRVRLAQRSAPPTHVLLIDHGNVTDVFVISNNRDQALRAFMREVEEAKIPAYAVRYRRG